MREDLLYAFQKAIDAGLEEPLRQAVADLLIRVRSGMTPDKALDLMQKSLHHEHLSDLIIAIRFNFRYRGNLTALLEQMEIQMHRIEEEFERRRLSNARDVTLTLLILVSVPVLFVLRLSLGGSVRDLFFDTAAGQAALVLSAAVYLCAVVLFVLIRRQIAG